LLEQLDDICLLGLDVGPKLRVESLMVKDQLLEASHFALKHPKLFSLLAK
jgi:hypothetical protein